jgi:hypothetical protein
LRYQMKQPVAQVCEGDHHLLAIPSAAALPNLEHRLMPHLVTLHPRDEIHSLEIGTVDAATMQIAVTFLQFALTGPLMHASDLWSSGRSYYAKRPLPVTDQRASVDLYPGFVWSVVNAEGGRLFVAIDTCMRYVDRFWLPEHLQGGDPHQYLRRYCLYHFGHNWYVVQLWGITGKSVAEQQFLVRESGQASTVFTYTQERWRNSMPQWVKKLSPESPAVLYRYPGKDQDAYGALALCKLVYNTQSEALRSQHRRSITQPAQRFAGITDVVERHFQHARLGNAPIRVATEPLSVERKVFPMPDLRFSGSKILRVPSTLQQRATQDALVTPLVQVGRQRLQLTLDPQVRPADSTPFDPQYLVVPHSLPRAIGEHFEQSFIEMMRRVSGQETYAIRRIIYEDRGANTLSRQVQAIRDATARNQITHGYALLILPAHAKRDLHDHIKRALWPNLQFQCALASNLQRYYLSDQSQSAHVDPAQVGKLEGYMRGCALGMMLTNRKWLWQLASPLHCDVHIGIDVLNGIAGMTFVYNKGQHIIFRHFPSKQRERLSAGLMRTVLNQHLRTDLADLGIRPQSIVIHRDGRSFASELQGLHMGLSELINTGVLPTNVRFGVADIHKTSVNRLRIVDGDSLGQAHNCVVGTYYLLDNREGILCTTGTPYQIPGTANPLAVSIVDGDLDLMETLEDIFALSQLTFTAPDRCMRTPITIKLANDLLEPIASAADEDAALYDDIDESEDADYSDLASVEVLNSFAANA